MRGSFSTCSRFVRHGAQWRAAIFLPRPFDNPFLSWSHNYSVPSATTVLETVALSLVGSWRTGLGTPVKSVGRCLLVGVSELKDGEGAEAAWSH